MIKKNSYIKYTYIKYINYIKYKMENISIYKNNITLPML